MSRKKNPEKNPKKYPDFLCSKNGKKYPEKNPEKKNPKKNIFLDRRSSYLHLKYFSICNLARFHGDGTEVQKNLFRPDS